MTGASIKDHGTPGPSGLNGDIQALRGIAILMVMVQHYRSRLPTSDGLNWIFHHFSFWSGVDLFFVVSGFVICKSLMANTGVGAGLTLSRAEASSFLKRRFMRLAPAAWFWLAASALLILVAPELSTRELGFGTFMGHIAAMTGTANLYWSHCVFHKLTSVTCTSPDVTGVFWSLSFEEQFYLFLAVALLVVSLKRLAVTLGVAALAFTVFCIVMGDMKPFSMAWAFRFHGFVLGIGLAIVATRTSLRDRLVRVPHTLRFAVIAVGTACLCLAPPLMFLEFSIPFLALISATMVMAAMSDGSLPGFIGRTLSWIGDRSYSLYLCHLVVFHFVRKAAEAVVGRTPFIHPSNFATLVWMAIAFGLAFGAAHLSYRYVERRWLPVRHAPRPVARHSENAA